MRQYGTLGFEVPLPGYRLHRQPHVQTGVGVPMDMHGSMLLLLPVRALIVGAVRPNSQVRRNTSPGVSDNRTGVVTHL